MEKRASPTIDLILPCLNEAAALPAVFRLVPAAYRVILVDNGSTDGSADDARKFGATVVKETRRGYGSAVHAGLLAATADIVVVMDCDGSLDPRELVPLVADVTAGRAHLAVGRRVPVSRASWPWHARTGNRILAGYLRSCSDLAVSDLAPVRVAARGDLLGLDVRDRRCGYPVETLLRAAQAKWRVVEHDMSYSPRALGTRSKITGSLRGTAVALLDMSRAVADPRNRLRDSDRALTGRLARIARFVR